MEFLTQLVAMLERRLGNRLANQENPIAIMVHLGNDQRLIIAFPGAEALNRARREESPHVERQLR